MTRTHLLGFPRIGGNRELKTALEAHWAGKTTPEQLQEVGRVLRASHWQLQKDQGVDLLPVGDFHWYDQVLTHSLMFGAVPQRFQNGQTPDLQTLFHMARGTASGRRAVTALEMTKWFDTNYHYLVPEFTWDQTFTLAWTQLFDEVKEAHALGHPVKPILIGPLTYLWLGKTTGGTFDKLDLLDRLLPLYLQILHELTALGCEWVQIDEPILGLDLPTAWQKAFGRAYGELQNAPIQKLLTTYFSGIEHHLDVIKNLPVQGLHIDLVRAPQQLQAVLKTIPASWVLSLGVVSGRNVWRCDLDQALEFLHQAEHQRGSENLWVSASCSLLHTPIDLKREPQLPENVREQLAFAVQKCQEIRTLADWFHKPGNRELIEQYSHSRNILQARQEDPSIHKVEVQARLRNLTEQDSQRSEPFQQRIRQQKNKLQLPLFPTTTIGSLPQTPEIRKTRKGWKSGKITDAEYTQAMQQEIQRAVRFQEDLGLDVLVHGEAERNDMVEYFAEQLDGFVFTQYGWVQGYGSRCVKPPILFGDISRDKPMTLQWITHAQSLTRKPMKGMLTGPITLLMWAFPREDITRETQAYQLALAVRDEVQDLEAAGISIIQIDEAAFREGLPLREKDQLSYLNWAVRAFRLCSSGVRADTQIHTHMCYSDFNGIIEHLLRMDADVITIETSRSHMELLSAFETFQYTHEVGPGVYDIHSPRVPSKTEMLDLLHQALKFIPAEQLWVNPDCGLKTRGWPEVHEALRNMVDAAHKLREEVVVQA